MSGRKGSQPSRGRSGPQEQPQAPQPAPWESAPICVLHFALPDGTGGGAQECVGSLEGVVDRWRRLTAAMPPERAGLLVWWVTQPREGAWKYA